MIYLDNSATTNVYKEVLDELNDIYKNYNFNPSASYDVAGKVELKIKHFRKIVAESINANESEIIFTSGGSEGANSAILGVARANINKGKHIVTSMIEHSCVYNTVKYLQEKEGYEVTYLKPDKYGTISVEQVENAIKKDTILVTLMHVNNEIGAINDIDEISKVIKQKNEFTYFHTDCVQSYMKLPIDVSKNKVDMLSVSGHKIHCVKGIGFMYIRKNTKINPLIYGGGQEMGFRSGTENVAGICALGKAVEMQADFKKIEYIKNLKLYFIQKIKENITDFRINSNEISAPHIISISFAGIKSEILLHYLEMDEIYVSAGSACSTKKKGSRVLDNIDLEDKYKSGTIRFSLCEENTKEQLDFTINKLKGHINSIRKVMKYKG